MKKRKVNKLLAINRNGFLEITNLLEWIISTSASELSDKDFRKLVKNISIKKLNDYKEKYPNFYSH